jgi:hypothetical protein
MNSTNLLSSILIAGLTVYIISLVMKQYGLKSRGQRHREYIKSLFG